MHFICTRWRFPSVIEVLQLLILNTPVLYFIQAHRRSLAKSPPVVRVHVPTYSPGHLRFHWWLKVPFKLRLCTHHIALRAPPALRTSSYQHRLYRTQNIEIGHLAVNDYFVQALEELLQVRFLNPVQIAIVHVVYDTWLRDRPVRTRFLT